MMDEMTIKGVSTRCKLLHDDHVDSTQSGKLTRRIGRIGGSG